MCTIHANSAREAVVKLCTLPLLAGENVSQAWVVPTPSVLEQARLAGRCKHKRAASDSRPARRPRHDSPGCRPHGAGHIGPRLNRGGSSPYTCRVTGAASRYRRSERREPSGTTEVTPVERPGGRSARCEAGRRFAIKSRTSFGNASPAGRARQRLWPESVATGPRPENLQLRSLTGRPLLYGTKAHLHLH